jgi:hypothetical protein
MQGECKNSPLCYFCHDIGHMSTHCPKAETQKQGLVMYGFRISRLGFYHIPVTENLARNDGEVFSGILIIREGVANTALVRRELKFYGEK